VSENLETRIRVGDLRMILATRQNLLGLTEGLDANEIVKVKVLKNRVQVAVERTGEIREQVRIKSS